MSISEPQPESTRAKMRRQAKNGGEALARKVRREDPNYYKQIGRMGGKAKARRAASDPAFDAKIRKQNAANGKLGRDEQMRIVAAGKLVLRGEL